MLSDEEKKALELIKINNKHKYCDKDDVDFLLNLIEKQSKEIEELKEQCKEVVCIPEGTCFMLEPKNVDKKWEDKIKAKIEELDYNDIGNFERRCKQEVLQELLGKE